MPSRLSIGSGRGGQILAEELCKRPLTDEADTGAVGLGMHRQSCPTGAFAHFILVQLSEREQHATEALTSDCMQKVGLIFAAVLRLQ